MIRVTNIRIGETTDIPETRSHFTTALVDLETWDYFLVFKIHKKLEKDVPVICEWCLSHSVCELWSRVDTYEKLPSHINFDINMKIMKLEEAEQLKNRVERYEILKSKKL